MLYRKPESTSLLSSLHQIHNHWGLTLNHLTNLLTTTNSRPSHAAQIHAHLITSNNLINPVLSNQLINLYARLGHTAQALLTFHSTIHQSNIITWTSLISHQSHSHHPHDAVRLFSQLLGHTTLAPNHFTFSAILPACAATGVAVHGRQVHAIVHKLGFDADVFVGSALVDMYAKCDDMVASETAFDEMPVRNLVTWNSLIVGFTKNKIYDRAIVTFRQLLIEQSTEPDEVSFSSVLSACANTGGLSLGKTVHGLVHKIGMETLLYVKNSIIDLYGKCGCFEDTVELFTSTENRDVVSWNVMMMSLVHGDRHEKACKYFWLMRREGVIPDEASFSTVLHASASLASWSHGAAIHNQSIKIGFENNQCVGSSLITMYAKCGSLDEAYQVFLATRHNLNVVSWTAMIAAFQQHGHADKVIELLEKMLEEGMELDYITFVCVLSACSHNGLVDQGFGYFNCMSKIHGMAPRSEHYACIVDMLGRAGRLAEAKQFIDTMPIEPDASVWGALLGACRNCRNLEMGREVASRLFEIEPENPGNYVLLSNIYASHGRLEDAKEVRSLMGINGVRKETGCSWIDFKNRTYVFTVHDRSHHQTKEIYDMLKKMEEKVKEMGYVPDTRFAINEVGGEYKEERLWYHSERLALAFAMINLPADAPIRIKKNLRTCGDCHTVMKLVSGIFQRELVLRDTNRFHRFTDGSCSCKDYW